jgi:hypothetical protein
MVNSLSFTLPKAIFGTIYFPDNLLPETFSYLSPSDLSQVARVCKIWSNSIGDQLVSYKLRRFCLAFYLFYQVLSAYPCSKKEEKLYREVQSKFSLGKEEVLKMIEEDPMLPEQSFLKRFFFKTFGLRFLQPSIYVRFQETIFHKMEPGSLLQLPIKMDYYQVRETTRRFSLPAGIRIISWDASYEEFLKNLKRIDPSKLFISSVLLQRNAFLEAIKKWILSIHGRINFQFIASFPFAFKEEIENSYFQDFLTILTGRSVTLLFKSYELKNSEIAALAEWINQNGENNQIILGFSDRALKNHTSRTLSCLTQALQNRDVPICFYLKINNQPNLVPWLQDLLDIEQINDRVQIQVFEN